MKAIRNITDVENLKVNEQLIECYRGEVKYYRFLCFHPRNENYVILLNHCEQPERFGIQSLIDRFFTDYSTRDILNYRRDYIKKELREIKQSLSWLDGKNNMGE